MSGFDFDFTVEKLKAALPGIKEPEEWMKSINKLLPVYGITTKERVAMFLAQTGHESNNWTVLEENLYYSADGLLKVFPKYYKSRADAESNAKKPALIANRVYANRMGNGDAASGDGYSFRGRGIIQITGKNNYTKASTALYGDNRLLKTPDLLKTKDGAIGSAAWFWNVNNLNAASDKKDVVAATKTINGGTNGLEDRKAKYAKILKLL
jgi:putative chitinase